MPRFNDGASDMQEPLGCVAKQIANAVMDAEADQLCGGGRTNSLDTTDRRRKKGQQEQV